VGADEKINTRTESINDVRPASHQAPGVVEILTDPISPALPNAHTVNGPDVTRKPRQIENDEKTLPAEKQPRVNQTPGIAAPANGPVKDTPTTHLVGSGPSNQLPGDVKEVVDHVIRHINSNLKNGPTSMHLQLSPKELGAIDVQMVSDSQGVHVTFFAEQASTGKLLETQLDQLRVSLLDSGVHLSGLDIGQHNQSGQKGGSFEQSPNFTRDFSWNFPDAQTVSQEKPSLKRSLGRSSDIDYLI
jgi:flagellar hook-length control protein FliK